METEKDKLSEIEVMAREAKEVAITNEIKEVLRRDLGPIAIRMGEYADFAATVKVSCKADDDTVTEMDQRIADDIKTVEGHDVLSKIIKGLDRLHTKACSLRGMFVDPMKAYRKKIREPALKWQAEEKRKADDIARKLQAENDAKVAREREALLKKADALKTPEKKEALREQAAALNSPTVIVEADESGLSTRKAWKVKHIHEDIFFRALSDRHELRGFVEINATRMERAKATNPNYVIPGVEFKQIVR